MGSGDTRQAVERSASGPGWGPLEEVVAHDGDQCQKHGVLLEIHLLVAVLIKIAHQLLQSLLIHLLLNMAGSGVITQLLSDPQPKPPPLH